MHILSTTFIILTFLSILSFFCTNRSNFTDDLFLSVSHTRLLKGLAILLVIFTHIVHSSISISALPGALGVCIFLFLSGYGLHRSYLLNELSNYFVKRITRVLVPYFVVSIALIILYGQYDVIDLLKYLSLISYPKGVHGWFLQHLILMYVIFFLGFFLFKNQWLSIIFILSASLSIIFIPNSHPSLRNQQLLSFFFGVFASFTKDTWKQIINNMTLRKLSIYFMLLSIVSYFLKRIFHLSWGRTFLTPILMQICLLATTILFIIISYLYISTQKRRKSFIEIHMLGSLYIVGFIVYELYLTHGPLQFIIHDNNFFSSRFLFLMTSLTTAYILHVVCNSTGSVLHTWFTSGSKTFSDIINP